MSREPEGPWVQAMIRAKATDPRNGRPSWNRLAEMAGVSTTTITKMIEGQRGTSVLTIRKVSEALRVPPETISDWLERDRPVRGPYVPPSEADLLDDRQRDALSELIRAIAASKKEGDGDDRDAAPTNNVTELSERQRTVPEKRVAYRPKGGRKAEDDDD